MKRTLVAIAAALMVAAPAHAAKPFTVGTGQGPGVALDDAGTAYVAWQVNVYDPGDAVQLCVVPRTARQCASNVTVAFPGQGYNRSRASVLLSAPNVVDVIVPRTTGSDAGTYLARSTDGGRTFAPAIRISASGFEQAVPGPGGRVALVAGPVVLRADLAGSDGSTAGTEGAELGGFLEGQFNDVAAQGGDLVAASSDAGDTQAFRLPAGANSDDSAAWQTLPVLNGQRQPELAGGPAGLAVMLEPSGDRPGGLLVRRLDGTSWSEPVGTGFGVLNNDFELSQNARGRLTALKTDGLPYRLEYTTSTDGGVLWSSAVTVARYGEPYPADLEMATTAGGRGAAVIVSSVDDDAVRVVRFSPRAAPVRGRRFGGSRVQVRSVCDDEKLRVVVEAARGGRRISPARVLRRARFGRARRARRVAVRRFSARYVLRSRGTRVRVRLVRRSGRSVALRLPVRRCPTP